MRLDPAGISPAIRSAVWVAIFLVRSAVFASSATRNRARPEAVSASFRCAFLTTAPASSATRRAIVMSSELMRCTTTRRSSLLRLRLALTDRARLSTERVRSAIFVRLANPINCSFLAVFAILATPFARRAESEG
jgi:hypothetical protein